MKNEIQELFNYSNGQLFWKSRPKFYKNPRGDLSAGVQRKDGRWKISLPRNGGKKRVIYRSLAVWLWHGHDVEAGLVLDHINRDRSDDSIENLRAVTPSQNSFNRYTVHPSRRLTNGL